MKSDYFINSDMTKKFDTVSYNFRNLFAVIFIINHYDRNHDVKPLLYAVGDDGHDL